MATKLPVYRQKISTIPGPDAQGRYLVCPGCGWAQRRSRGGTDAEGRTRRCTGVGCNFIGTIPAWEVDNAHH